MAELWAGFAVCQELILVLFVAWLVRYFAMDGMSIIYMSFVHVAWCVCRVEMSPNAAHRHSRVGAGCL